MQEKKIAFVFPAFVTDYREDPTEGLPGFSDYLDSFLQKASHAEDPRLIRFHYIHHNFSENELLTQYISYILSCALSDYFSTRKIIPQYCAGYSMGLYAAMYHAGSVSFEEGLVMIREAYRSIGKITDGQQFGMGIVIGLERVDLEKMIVTNFTSVEITNQNSIYSFVISGNYNEIAGLLEMVRNEGALHTRELRVTIPYHSSYIKKAAAGFANAITGIPIRMPAAYPRDLKSPSSSVILSLIDQEPLVTPEALRKEVMRNIHTPLNWLKTQLRLQELGVNVFLECGPDSGLIKNARFIEGGADFLSPSQAIKLQSYKVTK